MINVIQNNDLYELSFSHDPAFIEIVKAVPGRRWHPEERIWTIPADKLGWLLNGVRSTPYKDSLKIISNESLNVNSTLESTSVIPDIDISKIPFYVKEGATPFKHQLDFMKYAIHRQLDGIMSGFILAD